MTFLEAWENIRNIKEQSDDDAIGAIFTGINVVDDFWDNFILVCNNKDGMAALLNVSPEKIASWPFMIQSYLEKAKDHKNPDSKEKTKIISTGETNEEL